MSQITRHQVVIGFIGLIEFIQDTVNIVISLQLLFWLIRLGQYIPLRVEDLQVLCLSF